jgi:thiol-disulfide isomerase/thioredoxin
MKLFNKHFFIGFGAGILFLIILAGAGSYLMYWWFSSKDLSDVSKVLEGGLEAPPFPSDILADYNWTMKSLDGKDFNMTEARGKVVFLNFWATWCAPCVAEMPSIQRLYDKAKKDQVIFVCVTEEESSKVIGFIKEKGFTFPIYMMSGKPPAVFKTRGIPATFILSPEGKVAFSHVGSAKWDDERSIEFIKGLLK